MTQKERDRLRTLQDRWLRDPLVRCQVETHGENHPIATADAPTFRDVRTMLLPQWEAWFREFLEEKPS